VQQACAANGREFYRVNITAETSEDDLLGGFRLVNGNMVWIDGPVVVAMKRGGILLLDEFEFGTSKMLCLQPVLEGKPVFLKKTNTWVHPAKGFNILATGNTKGDGDETGRYIGTNPMNAAFLDRFAETVEHLPPSEAVELKIVKGALKDAGVTDDAFAKNIVKWAARTRMDFVSGDANEEVSTRRLEYLVKAYAIYGDRLKAVQKVIARFDETAKAAFEKYYLAIDDEATKELAQANAAADNLGQPPTEDTATAATAATAATDDATVTATTATPVPF
jgi:MoxR-like ATPase